jgi:Uri superfamily endonuclease
VKEAAAFSTAQVATSCLNEMSLERARRLVEQVTHDLPLLLTRIEPPAATRRALWNVALDVHCTASKIADATRPLTRSKPKSLLNDSSEGPEDRPGTYVMVMTLKRSMSLRIGRLETFWLPAGYLLYVGSAFGGGGVRGRTRRHRQAIAPKMWNLDHVKAVARPVEIWWTHFEKKVECRWAMALADLEGYRCPAPGFGSNDCQTCPAHFYHRSDPPSAEAFTERIGQTIPDHGAIFRMALSDERLVPTGIHRDR